MGSTERLGVKVGIDSMIDALHDWVRTEFVGKGSELQSHLTSVEEAFAAGWMARAHALSPRQEEIQEVSVNISERVDRRTAMIPPTPVPPTAAWEWTTQVDGSRTLNTRFTVVKDGRLGGKMKVDIHMNMARGGPFSIAAALGAAAAAKSSSDDQDISTAL